MNTFNNCRIKSLTTDAVNVSSEANELSFTVPIEVYQTALEGKRITEFHCYAQYSHTGEFHTGPKLVRVVLKMDPK